MRPLVIAHAFAPLHCNFKPAHRLSLQVSLELMKELDYFARAIVLVSGCTSKW